MGCGCKNKGNQTQPAPAPAQSTNTVSPKPVTNESVKDAIKKTVEKYYFASKK